MWFNLNFVILYTLSFFSLLTYDCNGSFAAFYQKIVNHTCKKTALDSIYAAIGPMTVLTTV